MASKNELIVGGAGKDNFVLRYGMGSDVIRDFSAVYYTVPLIPYDGFYEPPVPTSATGTAAVGVARDGQSAFVTFTVKGLTSPVTDAAIFRQGVELFDVKIPANKTGFSKGGTWNAFTDNQIEFYVKTQSYPDGELHGHFFRAEIDRSEDKIDLTAVNITSMWTLREFLSEVGGSTKITLIRNGEKSSFTLKGVPLRQLREEDFKFSTSTKKDNITGTQKVDTLIGGGGNDTLKGLGGNDLLFGEFGNDVITGGAGRDHMWGGRGQDRFDFNAVSETGKTSATRDVIHDFDRLDVIDLRDIDANGSAAGNGKFIDFSFGKAFSGQRGDLNFYLSSDSKGRPLTIVAGDVDGDKKADFQIELEGRHKLSMHDFIL